MQTWLHDELLRLKVSQNRLKPYVQEFETRTFASNVSLTTSAQPFLHRLQNSLILRDATTLVACGASSPNLPMVASNASIDPDGLVFWCLTDTTGIEFGTTATRRGLFCTPTTTDTVSGESSSAVTGVRSINEASGKVIWKLGTVQKEQQSDSLGYIFNVFAFWGWDTHSVRCIYLYVGER